MTPLVEILQSLPLNKSKRLFDPLNLILNSLAYFSHTSIRISNPDRVGASRLRSSAKATDDQIDMADQDYLAKHSNHVSVLAIENTIKITTFLGLKW